MKFPYLSVPLKPAFKPLSQQVPLLIGIVFTVQVPFEAIAQTNSAGASPQMTQTMPSVRPDGDPDASSTPPEHSPTDQGETLPQSVREAVLNDLSTRTSLPASTFTIVSVEPRTWSDGCLGLSAPGQFCTQVIVPGWQVIVSHNQQQWIYRTDETGSQVRLAERPSNGTSNDTSTSPGSISLTQTCTNEAAGYTIRYPAEWHTNTGEVVNQCRVFDPEPISLPVQSESLDEAVHIRVSDVSYDRASQTDEFTATELSRRSITVDGQPAVVIESEATGRGLVSEGVRIYQYIVNLSNQTLIAATYDVQGQDYQRNQQVLDQMMDSIEFSRSSANVGSTPTVLNGPTDRTFTIAGLPNGNYRFCSDDPPSGINRVSGVCFRFRKTGEDIVGEYYYPYEGSSICFTGEVNGNTVTGQGLELLSPTASPPPNLPGEDERTDWRQEGFLQVGHAERVNNFRDRRAIRYRSAILDLNGFYQYNAGTVLPPQQCF